MRRNICIKITLQWTICQTQYCAEYYQNILYNSYIFAYILPFLANTHTDTKKECIIMKFLLMRLIFYIVLICMRKEQETFEYEHECVFVCWRKKKGMIFVKTKFVIGFGIFDIHWIRMVLNNDCKLNWFLFVKEIGLKVLLMESIIGKL